jgi:hypothetical protein
MGAGLNARGLSPKMQLLQWYFKHFKTNFQLKLPHAKMLLNDPTLSNCSLLTATQEVLTVPSHPKKGKSIPYQLGRVFYTSKHILPLIYAGISSFFLTE